MRIIRNIKTVSNTPQVFTASWKKFLKVLHSCLSSEITLSLSTRVILSIFVLLSDKKGFIVFQTLYYLLLCLALSCYSTSFLYNLLSKLFFFLYNRKLSVAGSFKVLS